MNTWRDINTAKPMEVILATEDNAVYVGTIRDYDNGDLVFRGFNLQDGIRHLCMAEDLTGWQPIPNTWKPEKTADEMFRELGYEKQLEGKYVTFDGENSCITFFDEDEFSEGYPFVSIERSGGYELDISFDEALAIAQRIREMEANNG